TINLCQRRRLQFLNLIQTPNPPTPQSPPNSQQCPSSSPRSPTTQKSVGAMCESNGPKPPSITMSSGTSFQDSDSWSTSSPLPSPTSIAFVSMTQSSPLVSASPIPS